jgi:hypothetical protein
MDIKDLIVLTDDQKDKITGLPSLFDNYISKHTEFQIRNFILNEIDWPTDEGKYHQSVRELFARYENLIHLSYQYRVLKNEIEVHELKKEELELDLNLMRPEEHNMSSLKKMKMKKRRFELYIEKEQIEIDDKKRRLVLLKKQASETMREMEVFIDVVNTLDQFIPDHHRDENGLPDREKSEANFWISKQLISEGVKGGEGAPFYGRISDGVRFAKDKLGRLVFLPKKEKEIDSPELKLVTQEDEE